MVALGAASVAVPLVALGVAGPPLALGAWIDDEEDGTAEARGLVEVIADVTTIGAEAMALADVVMVGVADAVVVGFAASAC